MKSYVASHLKDMNRQKIFNFLLKNNKGVFRQELSRMTGISAPTVLKIVDFMVEKGLVREIGAGEASVGRKPNMLELNVNRYYIIGVEYEGDFMSTGIVNLAGKIVHFSQVKCNRNFEYTLYCSIERLLKISDISLDDILGVGIGIPGIYNQQTREIFAPLIGYSKKEDFGAVIDKISERYNILAVVDNEVNMQALGEFHALGLGESDDLLHISVGTGLGAGIILGGKIRHGANFMSGEIGYMAFDKNANSKEVGWLETRTNMNILESQFGIMPFAEPADKKSLDEAIEYTAHYLSLCINNIITLMDIDNITLGGLVVEMLEDGLVDRVNEKLSEICITEVKVMRQASSLQGVVGASLCIANKAIPQILSD